MRVRTNWSPMLIILPMVALALALVLWGRDGRDYNDYVAAQAEPRQKDGGRDGGCVDSTAETVCPASAAPSVIAFPDKTCWLDLKGMEYFCFRLTVERR